VTPVIAYSGLVLLLVFVGVALRKRPRAHIPIMLTAFALDLGSVVYLQLARNAVGKTASSPSTLLLVHVTVATATILLYAAMTATGWRLAATGRGRAAHRTLARIFLVCRIATWVTSFFTTPA